MAEGTDNAKKSLRKLLKKCLIVHLIILDRLLGSGPRRVLEGEQIKKIVLLELQGIGDAVATIPTAKALKETFPDAKITLVTQRVAAGFFKGQPCYEEIVPLGYSKTELGIKDFLRTIRQLRKTTFDLLVIPSWSLRHSVVGLLLKARAKVGYLHDYSLRATYHNDYPVEIRGIRARGSGKYLRHEHIVTRSLRAIEPLGIRANEDSPSIVVHSRDRRFIADLLNNEFGVDRYAKFVVCCPGAVWEHRKWRIDYWRDVIRQLRAHGMGKVFVIGSAGEHGLCATICDGEFSFNLAGRLTLPETVALLEAGSMFLGVDSGPMHLASSLKKPVIALFGPNIPEVCGPQGELCCVIEKKLPCRPCDQEYCPVPAGERCMDLITPEDVMDAYGTLMPKADENVKRDDPFLRNRAKTKNNEGHLPRRVTTSIHQLPNSHSE
jgi:ADP-heptose:LPS heptosyltransferase